MDAEIKKKAEAEKYARQQKADAELYERQRDAEAKTFEALKEAEAIRAKALPEAEGIMKKAEAMKQYGQAAVLEMYFNALPEIAKNVASPLNNVKKLLCMEMAIIQNLLRIL